MSVHDQLLSIVNQRADEITTLPSDQRDDRYAALKVEHLGKAAAMGLPETAAQELAAQMEVSIKRRVATMEADGDGGA
jgi:hypothetical protein